MRVRELTRGEVGSLPEEFYGDVDKMGNGTRFTPETAVRVAGAFEGDRLVGVWVMSLQVHAAPMWVAPEFRGRSKEMRDGMWKRVVGFIRDTGSRVAFLTQTDNAPEVGGIIEGLAGRKVGALYQVEV
jgi:hypothetical protein